jgi:uncharacterized protein (TIGR04222 family)
VRRLAALLPLVVCPVICLVLWSSARPAVAAERISSYDVQLQIQPSGDLQVIETIAYDFGSTPHHGIYRDVPTRLRYDDRYDRLYPLRVDGVSAQPGGQVPYTVEDAGGGMTRIKIGDPDRTITGAHTYTITYTVQGALNAFEDHDELYWNAIGAEWSVSIDRATVEVRAPADIEGATCFAGPEGSSLACDRSSSRGNEAAFAQRSLYPYEALTIVVGLPTGAVDVGAPILEERWSLRRAFVADAAHLTPAFALLLLGIGLFAHLAWTKGRDRRYQGSQIDQVMGNPGGPTQRVPLGEGDDTAPVEFAPPEGIRPGQAGVLLDERANTVDVVATIVDLAVRGFLVIQEIPKQGFFGKPDWRLIQLEEDRSPLLTYERSLLEGIFRDGGDVTLSSLRRTFSQRLAAVEEHLYVDAAQRGWFTTRPDRIRLAWRALGLLLIAIGGVVAFLTIRSTGFGYLGIAALVVGLVFWFGARAMPSRTAKGTAMLRRVRGYRQVIDTADRYMARWAEQENVFTTTLPYAVVFGLTDKWAEAFAALAEDPTATPAMAWYVPAHGFSLDSFAESLDGFTVATSGTMTATPAGSGGSGFGGGGFSGGGGGGGGGGSW